MGVASSPCAAPVQDSLLESLVPIEKEFGKARNRERWGGTLGAASWPSHASPRDAMAAEGR